MDGIVIIGTLGLTVCLYILKIVFHFEYLKVDRRKFKTYESLPHMMFGVIVRPFYVLDHLWDMIRLFFLPVLWAFRTNKYRLKVAVICYGLLLVWIAVVGYFYLTGSYLRY